MTSSPCTYLPIVGQPRIMNIHIKYRATWNRGYMPLTGQPGVKDHIHISVSSVASTENIMKHISDHAFRVLCILSVYNGIK